MGTTLTGKRVQNTYDSLLKIGDNDNLTGTAKRIGDGLGNDSPIFLSTTKIGIGVTPTYEFQTNSHAKIGGNLIVGGNLTVNGTTTIIDSTVIAIGDNMMEMAKDNVSNTMDIGWYGTINSSGEKFVGVFYDASSGVATPEFHIGLGTSEPSSTASWTTKGKLVIGALDATTGVFSGQVTIPETPSANTDAASKGYVDSAISSGSVEVAKRIEITVKNISGGSLSKGTIVHASPSATPPSGNVVEVIVADYDTASAMPGIGVLNETIADEAEGAAVMLGAVSGIDTSSFSAGDELYVGNNGAFTNTKPTATTQLIQKIAIVLKVHASNGSIKVFGAGRVNDVPNEVDRDLSIAGNLTVDDTINIESSSGYGNIEIGGPSGGYIDLKAPFSDDYDIRIITSSGGNEITTASGDLKINTGNTLALTLDGSNQNATFAGNISLGGATIANDYKIEVIPTGGNILRSTRGTSVFAMYQGNNSHAYIGTTSDNEFRILQNDTTALTINTSGHAVFANNVFIPNSGYIKFGSYSYIGEDLQSLDSLTIASDHTESIFLSHFNPADSTYTTNLEIDGDGDAIFSGNVDIYTGDSSATLNIGRNSSERLTIYQDDNHTILTAYNDSDGDGDHDFRLNRAFDGSGANNFIVQKDGTAQLTIDTNANATFAGNVTISSTGSGTFSIINTNASQTWGQYVGSNDDYVFRDFTDSRSTLILHGDGNASFAGKVGVAGTTMNANHANFSVNLSQTSGTLGAANYAHFGSQAHTSGQIMGITLGYKEHANLSYRKIGLVAEGTGDGAARQHFHILVDDNNDSNSIVVGDSKLKINGLTGDVTIPKRLGIGIDPPLHPLQVNGQVLFRTTNSDGAKNRFQFIPGGSSDAANLYLYYGNSGDGTVSVRINAQGDSYFDGGSLGIGIKTPTATLHVSDASNSGVTTISANDRIKLSGDGVLRWGPSANYGILTWDTNKAIVGGQSGSTLELKSGSNFGLEIDTAGDINSPDLLYMRQTRFGYSASYKVVQFGNATTTSAISIGYNPSGNASGGFTGNEILIPNNRRILAPNAADNSFMGVLMFNDDDHLLLGGTNYNIDSTFALRTRGTGTGVIIRGGGTYVANENVGELKIGYAYASGGGAAGSATRLAIQPYAHTGGPWVFIARDTSSSAFLDLGYAARQITMKHNGYLGLGNADPQVDLHITNSSTAKLRVNTTGVADASLEVLGYDAGLHIGDNTNGNRWAIWNDGPSTSSSLKFGSYALGTWYANSSQVFTLTSAGLCGIGTATPSAKLDIAGVGKFGETFSTLTNSDSGSYLYTNPGNRLLTSNASGWYADGRDPILTLSSSGNSNNTSIGNSIGLNLHNNSNVNGTFGPLITFSTLSESSNYNSSFAAIGGKKRGRGPDTNWTTGDLCFWVTGPIASGSASYMQSTPSMVIATGGNLGINVASPSYKLDVLGTSGDTSTARFKAQGSTTDAIVDIESERDTYLRFRPANTNKWSIVADYPGAGDLTFYDYLASDVRVKILNTNMTGGWDNSLNINNQYPVLSFQSDAGPGYYAGLGYDGSYGLRFYLGASSTDIPLTGTHCGFIEKSGRWVIGAGSTSIHTSYALTIAGVSGSYASAIRMLSGSTQFFVGANSTSSTSDFELWNTGNGYIRFATNNIEYMRLTQTGLLQLTDENGGNAKLQVRNYSVGATGTMNGNYMCELRSAYAEGAYNGTLLVHTQEGANGRSALKVSDNNGVFATFDNGKMYLGQTSNVTDQLLQVNGFIDITDTTKAMRVYNPAQRFVGGIGSGQWAFASTYVDDFSIYAQSDLLIHAGTGSTIDMFVQSTTHRIGSADDGSVFTPGTRLHLKDNSDAQLTLEGRSTTWAGVLYKDVNGQAYNWFYGGTQTWAFGGGGSAVSGKRIHCDGGMTIGSGYDSVTMPTNGLWVQGTIKCADDLVAFDSSDKRLKDNIRKIENPLDKLDKINGYKFKWNNNQEIHEGEDYGVIAQEVQEVMPEIVNLKESGYYGVKYDKLIPLLIESVKELKAEIKELKNCKCDCK